MITQFVTAEVDLRSSPAEMQQAIEAELRLWGEPLRWAITAIKQKEQAAMVEAIVTTKAKG
ncbi:MAG: hypothetical protein KME45_31375 [Stenomitos rutilans HA7619-LM2]|nr:hypothetical protein [Stenomitos rutilans HA7619-LM2]